MIPLRKVLFGRDEPGRMLGAAGLITLLRIGTTQGCGGGGCSASQGGGYSLSQGGGSSQGDGGDASLVTMSQAGDAALLASSRRSGGFSLPGLPLEEGFGLLRRCLTQQAGVRASVYRGLDGLLTHEPALRHAALSLLHAHLQNLTPSDADERAPLLFGRCVDGGGGATTNGAGGGSGSPIGEPLPLLLSVLFRHLALVMKPPPAVREGGGRRGGGGGCAPSAWGTLADELKELVAAVAEADLPTLGLDKARSSEDVSCRTDCLASQRSKK